MSAMMGNMIRPMLRGVENSDPKMAPSGKQATNPEQSALMARRLSERGAYCRTAYFDDEGHGFTRQASISKALGVELDFSLQRAATAVRSA